MYRTLTPFYFLIAALASAQPIIQNGDNLPAPGFSVVRSEGNTNLAEGPAGADQTWDFSSVILNNNAQPYIVLEPAASEFAAEWPSADYVATYSDAGNDRYFYYNVLADRLEAVADNVSNTGDNNIYNANPRTKLKFPFAFGESVSDDFTDPFNTRTVVLTYDAYGTLITPTNTFLEVVRIKWQVGASDARYDWWTLDPLLPVLQYDNGYILQWANPSTGINDLVGSGSVSVQPNPFTDRTTITIDATTLAKSAHLTLTNATGQMVYSTSLTSTTTQLTRGALADGLYLYHVRTADGVVAIGHLVME